jgi:hypothetical protein
MPRTPLGIGCLLLCIASSASAQAVHKRCYSDPDSGWYACIDLPVHQAQVSRSQPLEISAWALSCVTGKQPEGLTITAGGVQQEAKVQWRVPHDVGIILTPTACPGISTAETGMEIVLPRVRFWPLGATTIVITFAPDAAHKAWQDVLPPDSTRRGPIQIAIEVMVVP